MKSKRKIFLLFLLVIFLFNIDSLVYAKECTYWIDGGSLTANRAGGTLTIKDNNSVSFKITNVNGKSKNRKESVQNWNDIKNTYISTGKCPDYALIYTGSNYKVYLYYDKLEADNQIISKGWNSYDITPGSTTEFFNDSKTHLATSNEYVPSEELSDMHYKFVEEALEIVKGYASNDYSLDGCSDDYYVSCKSKAEANRMLINGKRIEIDGYIASNYISSDDSRVKDFYSYYNNAVQNIDEYLKKIKDAKDKSNTGNTETNKTGDVDLGSDIEENCNGILGEDFLSFLSDIFKWVKIVVPILVIILGSVDFAGSLLQDEMDSMKKATNKFVKRLIIAVAIFLLTFILTFVLNIFNEITKKGTSVCEIGMINLIK